MPEGELMDIEQLLADYESSSSLKKKQRSSGGRRCCPIERKRRQLSQVGLGSAIGLLMHFPGR
jgi:hypothetical protein